jgi:hypothetical protein
LLVAQLTAEFGFNLGPKSLAESWALVVDPNHSQGI